MDGILNCNCLIPSIFVVVAVCIYFFIIKKKDPKLDPLLPNGKVLLHQFPRGPNGPNLSPFPIKLEMFLKLNKIP